MQTKRILDKAVANADDRTTLRRTAKFIVRDLRSRSLQTLATSRRDVSRSATALGGESFAAGYMTALGDVLAAFEAQLSDDLEQATDAGVAERPGFAAVLRALRAGHTYPAQIAAAASKKDYEVSRILKELRTLGLAEQRAEDTDKRRRPHHLTARGDAVVASFGDATAQTVAPVGTTIVLWGEMMSGVQMEQLAKHYDASLVDAVAQCVPAQPPEWHQRMERMESAYEELKEKAATLSEVLDDMPPALSMQAQPAAAASPVMQARPRVGDKE